ncbi:MAG: hypothetical protein ISS23_03085 [Nanoarchaeota archaeon]|nr:hypothetical protein [Nanoarchaeota archaeon]
MAAASDLKKGDYFKHSNEILRVIRKELVAYGTHSHSKLKLYVQGMDKKGEKSINMHHTDKVEILDIIRKAAQVLSKTQDKVQIMDNVSFETLDADAPEELFNEINEGDEVTFISLEGNIKVLEKR